MTCSTTSVREAHLWNPLWIIVILLVLFISCDRNQHLATDLQEVLDRGVKKYDLRGVSAAIVFDKDSIWSGASGISHDTVAMDPDMLFSIGSVTKSFVAALTMRLVEEGTLKLDDTLGEWLPSFPHIDPKITIRQLLNHTSGIFMYWVNDAIWEALKKDRSRIWKPEEVLEYLEEPHFEPGKGWRYSNTNYLLLAMIIEKATDNTLAENLKTHVWHPVGLDDFYLWLYDSIPDRQAHVFGDNFMFGAAEQDLTYLPRASHESIGFGSSGIVTSAPELAQWCYLLFDGQLLQDNSMNEMLHFEKPRQISNMNGYGLGVQRFSRQVVGSTTAWGHGGGNIGSATYMIYLPELKASVVVMVNAFPTSSVDFFANGLIKAIKKQKE